MIKTEQEINQELKVLYKKWPAIRSFLKEIGCTQQAEDIFQEALLIYHRRLLEPGFQLTVEPFHFVKNTCKFLWYNQSRKDSKMKFSEINEGAVADNEDSWWEKEQLIQSTENAVAKIGEKCQQLIKLFYGLKQSMEEIAKKLDFRNAKVAKAQKYRCIQKVKDILNQPH